MLDYSGCSALALSLLLAFLSIWSVWTPYITNWSYHDGEFEGYSPLCKLSYPLRLSVFHTPHLYVSTDGRYLTGSVSFRIFFADARVMEVDGSFSHPAVYGEVRLTYLNFPLFDNGEKFFIFLLILFTLFNFAEAIIGAVLTYAILKRLYK